ncbi:hypothetical protein WDW37_12495 [Bdellovibrionota bacterium FG-1]
MSETKKDLTGLLDYAKTLHKTEQTLPLPESSIAEDQPIDPVEHFESLEDYGRTAPSATSDSTSNSDPNSGSDLFPTTPADALPVPSDTFSGMGEEHLVQEEPLTEEPLLEESLDEPLRPALAVEHATDALQNVKEYSETISSPKSARPAAFPFSLLITGRLAPHERERLTDLISRENIGIREIDLEPQFEAGKILIPRISEYAGVMIVGALRSTQARMRLGPSDTIYATEDTQDASPEPRDYTELETQSNSSDSQHPAENIAITTASQLSGFEQHRTIDLVLASAVLKSHAVEALNSPEYTTLLEALTRELKYKAYRRGADAIVAFNIQLTQLQSPSDYRVVAAGTLIKKQ